MNMYLGKDIIENLSGGYFLVKFIIIKLFFFYGPKSPKFFWLKNKVWRDHPFSPASLLPHLRAILFPCESASRPSPSFIRSSPTSTITSDEEGRSELPERHQLISFSLPFLLHEPAAPAFTITTTLQPDNHRHLPMFISQSTARLKPTAAVIDSFFSRSTLVWCLMLSSCLLMFDVPIHSCWCLTFAELSEVIISFGQLCFG